MTPEQITILVVCLVVGIIIIPLIFSFIYTLKISKKVYFDHFVRTSDKVWGRECSCPTNKEQLDMFNQGLEWAKENKKFKKDVSVDNDGLHLVGEFYDFGYDKTVVIIPGRCESLLYSYYYAIGYSKQKINVLVIDQRGHGLSEGSYSTAGIKESDDILSWCYLLNKAYKQNEIILHGICIGASSAVLAVARKDTPQYIKKIIVDGLFISFYESVKRHTKDEGHPSFPVVNELYFFYKKYARVNIHKNSPIKSIQNVHVPVLFLHSKMDIYSLPKFTNKLYKKCGSSDKVLHYFDKGGHSHIRINNTKEYDKIVMDFINK